MIAPESSSTQCRIDLDRESNAQLAFALRHATGGGVERSARSVIDAT
jgi:hypothetical protein